MDIIDYGAGGAQVRSTRWFLYACVRRAVGHDLPEIDYLRRHDEAIHRIMDAVEMPDRLADNLVMFIRQNHGTLPRKCREGEFRKLHAGEVTLLEAIVRAAFEGFDEGSRRAAGGDANDD